jgi:hypothetical protein
MPIKSQDLCHLHLKVTGRPNLAPPGWYLLFIVDEHGVPSVGEWIHLGPRAHEPDHAQHHPAHPGHAPLTHLELHNPGFPIPGFEPPKPKKPRKRNG